MAILGINLTTDERTLNMFISFDLGFPSTVLSWEVTRVMDEDLWAKTVIRTKMDTVFYQNNFGCKYSEPWHTCLTENRLCVTGSTGKEVSFRGGIW